MLRLLLNKRYRNAKYFFKIKKKRLFHSYGCQRIGLEYQLVMEQKWQLWIRRIIFIWNYQKNTYGSTQLAQ